MNAGIRGLGADTPSTPRYGWSPPKVSGSVADAGKQLESVADAYLECLEQVARTNGDPRTCGRFIQGGVRIISWPDNSGGKLSLQIISDDGRVLRFAKYGTTTCRSLDDGDDCDAWGRPPSV